MKKLLALLAITALASLSLAACGGDDDEETTAATTPTTTETGGGGGGEETTLDLAADESALAFDTTSLEAAAGSVTINLDNPASLAHDVCIEAAGDEDLGCSDEVTQSTSSVTADLEPGDYTFYCSVDGHREAGMEGTLTVE